MAFTLRYRIVALTLLCLAPVVVGVSAALVRLASTQLWSGAVDDAASFADTVRRATRHAMLAVDRDHLEAIVREVAGGASSRTVRVYDSQGRLRLPTADAGPDLALDGPACTACHADPRRQAPAGAGRCAHRVADGLILYAPVPNEPSCQAGGCHPGEGRLLGILSVEHRDLGLTARGWELSVQAAAGGAVVLVVAALPLLLAFRWVLERPLAECLRLVREVTRGNLRVRSRLRRADEWGEFLAAFDGMIGTLEGTRKDLETWNRKLEGQVADRTRELEAALGEARESARLKTEFLTGITHEFSTPLQGVIGYADLLLDGIDGTLAPSQRHDVAVIRRNGHQLLALVEDLLELSRLEGGRRVLCLGRVSLGDVAEAAVDEGNRLAASKALSVRLTVAPGCPEVVGDVAALRQVLRHLVRNAVRYTEIGVVTVSVGVGPDGWIEVAVEDTGPGIDPEVLRIALQGFARKGGGGGLGVGLALSRRLVELHGGSLAVASTPGAGTRAVVRLPPEPLLDA